MRGALHFAVMLLLLGSVSAARAQTQPRRLDLTSIDAMSDYVASSAECRERAAAARATCLAALPKSPTDWDRNKSSAVDLVDVELAYAEYWDDGRLEAICYDARGATRFFHECNLESCLAEHEEELCKDADGDGLLAYQEAQIGTLESKKDTCFSNAGCGFSAECGSVTYDHDANAATAKVTFPRSVCVARTDCPASGCTAFHLREISQDDAELIVHVYYDYSPEPARALDLRIQVPLSGLTLTDARLLSIPSHAGKELAMRHVTEGSGASTRKYIRLLIYGVDSLQPIIRLEDIPPGGVPVVELAFAKTGPATGSVAFSPSSAHRTSSLAPNPEDRRSELAQPGLWGPGVDVASNSARKLLAHYSFDDSARPLRANVPAVDQGEGSLCELPSGSCGLTPSQRTAAQDKHWIRLRAAHAGIVDVSEYRDDGIVGGSARFAGAGDHLEPPLWVDPASQDMSWSFWAYPDDGGRGEAKQLLIGQADRNGVLRYGLYLERSAVGSLDLVFEQNDANAASAIRAPIATGLLPRTWMHVGLALSESARRATMHVRPNGATGAAISQTVDLRGPVLDCPSPESDLRTGLSLDPTHERIFTGQSLQGLYGITELDARGTSERSVVRGPDSSALDPDYSPIVDRLVYISDKTGGYEVWTSYPDGSFAEQITSGFGNTRRKVFARRPRWSPNGRTIIFESNAYEGRASPSTSATAGALDNVRYGSTRLFAIPYDPVQRKVAVPKSTGSNDSDPILDYERLADQQRVREFWLGQELSADHHLTGARWLDASTILFTESQRLFDGNTVRFATVRYENGRYLSVVNGTLPAAAEEVTLLDARRGSLNASSQERTLALVQLGTVAYSQNAASMDYRVESDPPSSGQVTFRVLYTPKAGDRCYDQNFNLRPDVSLEDLNGDKQVTVEDCYAREVSDLYVAYTSSTLTPVLTNGVPQSLIAPPGREVRLRDVELAAPATRAIKVELSVKQAGLDPGPMSANLEIARIRFQGTDRSGASLIVREVNTKLVQYERDANGIWAPRTIALPVVDGMRFGRVLASAYAPGVDRVALSVLLNARPVLMTLPTVLGATGSAQRLLTMPRRLEGLDWETPERYRACQWVGARRDNGPSATASGGEIVESYRGLLDEIKLYNYERSGEAFASEAERGAGWLKKRDATGQGDSLFACTRPSDCSAYEVCAAGTCLVQQCSGDSPCADGQCTLQPVPLAKLGQSGTGEDYARICSVECGGDSECFQRDCYAGPCRFCAEGSCIECRSEPDVEVATGVFRDVMAGCPDESRFACEEGSCVSECYSFDNGASRYLCSANEYCARGRCVAKVWDWTDFAPATFASGEDSYYGIPEISELQDTVVKSYRHTVELVAYGHTDYGATPELLVEAQANPSPYGDKWFTLGRVQVHHRTHSRASSADNRIPLHSPYPLRALRVSLVASPSENPFGGSVGYGTYDREPGRGLTPSASPRLGHSLTHPFVDLETAYAGQERDRYLLAGDSTVVISVLKLNGQAVLGVEGTAPSTVVNKVCAYQGTALKPPPSKTPINYAAVRTTLDTNKQYAVLNCVSSSDPTKWTGLLISDLPNTPPQQPSDYAGVKENGGGCFYEHITGASGVATYEPCYQFATGTVRFDPYAFWPEGHGSIEIQNAGSFGYTASTP